jgi:hypothetical protein
MRSQRVVYTAFPLTFVKLLRQKANRALGWRQNLVWRSHFGIRISGVGAMSTATNPDSSRQVPARIRRAAAGPIQVLTALAVRLSF